MSAILRARFGSKLPLIESVNSIFRVMSLQYDGDIASDGSCDSDDTDSADDFDGSNEANGNIYPMECTQFNVESAQIDTFGYPLTKKPRCDDRTHDDADQAANWATHCTSSNSDEQPMSDEDVVALCGDVQLKDDE